MPAEILTQLTKGDFVIQEQRDSFLVNILDVVDSGTFSPAKCVQGAYLHIPFCFHKCHYCDFYSIVDHQDRQGVFVRRMIAEIEAGSTLLTLPLESFFIGGGTPTLLNADLWVELLAAISQCLPLAPGGEFTVEANPETVTAELAEVLVQGGVNRVSLGAQSFNPSHLKTLERWHRPESVSRSVEIFRRAGVRNINLDLIFAIPGQTLDHWLNDLEEALALEPQHLSCYGLMYEPNTPLTKRRNAGAIQPVEEEAEAEMYEATMDHLGEAGYEHYEISNWARPGKRCRHNLLYWTNGNWWPFGPSAAGHLDGLRWRNVPRLSVYLNSGPLPPIENAERLDANARVGEELMLRLRLIDGIEAHRLDDLLKVGNGTERGRTIDAHVTDGLLQWVEGRLRLTRHGLLLADSVLAELL